MDLNKQKEISVDFNIIKTKYFSLKNRKRKNEEKQTEPEGPIYSYRHYRSRRREIKGSKKMIEEILAENFQNMMKNMNTIHIIQESQPTPKINSKRPMPKYFIFKV